MMKGNKLIDIGNTEDWDFEYDKSMTTTCAVKSRRDRQNQSFDADSLPRKFFIIEVNPDEDITHPFNESQTKKDMVDSIVRNLNILVEYILWGSERNELENRINYNGVGEINWEWNSKNTVYLKFCAPDYKVYCIMKNEPIREGNMRTLKDGESLDKTIIDAYMKKYSGETDLLCSAERACQLIEETSLQKLKDFLTSKNYPRKERIVFPLNWKKNHWTLFVVFVNSRKVVYLDPANPAQTKCCAWKSKTILEHWKLIAGDDWNPSEVKHTSQIDRYSSGVWICQFWKVLCIREEAPRELVTEEEYRNVMCGEFENCAKTKVCVSCGIKDEPLVRCSNCRKWYHENCSIGNAVPEKCNFCSKDENSNGQTANVNP